MANEQNLKPSEYKLSREEAKRGGKASGKARKEKKEIRERLKIAMSLAAEPSVAAKLGGITGIDVKDNADVVVASILRGVMKSNPQMIDRLMEYTGESKRAETRDAELEIARQRLEVERMKAELEQEKQRLWKEAMKSAQESEQEDDGFIEALSGTVKDDWSDEA